MSALDDRRQSAREAAYDMPGLSKAALGSATVSRMITEAIETATRVNITDDMIEQARMNRFGQGANVTLDDIRHLLVDIFRAAGFEVER